MESILNGLSFSLLLTALWVLRFRGWKRPLLVIAYFCFFLLLEVVTSRLFIPPGAVGSELAILLFGLSVPVLVAIYVVWRQERAHGESG